MKKFIRFRVRLVLMHLIAICPVTSTHDFYFLPQGADGEIWIKYSICAIYQPAEQNLLHEGNIFKDTVDPRERPSDRIFKRAILSGPW